MLKLRGAAPNQIQIMAVDGAQRPLSVFSEKLVNYGIDVCVDAGQ